MNAATRYHLRRLRTWLRRNWVLVGRMAQLTRCACRFAFVVLVADAIRRRRGDPSIPSRPVRVRGFFEDIGGSFLKLGQMMALQPDLIPIEYCDELFGLMDRIPPFDYATAERIFFEETGRDLQDVFANLRPEPIATASIGQVYVGELDGKRVAIKLQRPMAETSVTSDIRVAALAERLIRALSIKPLYWLLEPMAEFIRWSREELDFRHEARYTQKALDNARGEAHERVPEVYWSLTTQRVLVIEYLEGITVLDFLRKRSEPGAEPDKILPANFCSGDYCTHIVENFLGGAFNCGLYHADLHPGNLMMMPDSVVGYIDFGITGVLSEYSRTNLIVLTLAYAQRNVDQMLTAFLRVSTITSQSNLEKLERGLKARAQGWYGDGAKGRTSITAVMLDWLNLSKEAETWPQRDVIKYIRCSVVMDGLIKRLDPEFDVGAALAKAARGHLEAGLRRQVFSYERVFEAFASSGELIAGGPAALRVAISNVARALDLPVAL